MCESLEMNETVIVSNPIDIRAEKKLFSRIGLSLLVYTLLAGLLQFILTTFFGPLLYRTLPADWVIWIVLCIPQLCLGVPVCIKMLRPLDTLPPQQNEMRAGKFILYIIMCIGMMYAGNIIGTLLSLLLSSLNGSGLQAPVTDIVTTSNIWTNLLFAVLIVPFYEELLFRKTLIDRMRKYGDKTAIMVSALLFALLHGNLNQFFYAFGLGLLFGYVYAQTGLLRYSIILHMFINFLGSVVSVKVLEAIQNSGPQFSLASIYPFLLLGLAVTGMVQLLRKRKLAVYAPAVCELPRSHRTKTIFQNAGMLAYILICIVTIAAFHFS